MALDGKILARAKRTLAEKKRLHEAQLARRLENAFARAPRIRELDYQIRSTMTELFGAALSEYNEALIEDINIRNIELQDQLRAELVRAGFPDDYLDDSHMCPICRDTGFDGTKMCVCLTELYKAELKASLSNLLKLGSETFDSFDLTYYDDTPAPDSGISPRRMMDIIYETCVEYARKFGKKSMNLFFNGAPGLGKTFLSACIARVVADNGFSVVYETASALFSKFEDVQFSRVDDIDEARGEIKRYLECDLLIIDDLGTEFMTSFTIDKLYETINTRLMTGRKTIISSNLTINELHSHYNRQIMSRLEGEYHVLTFRGEDIRKKRSAV